MRANIAAACCVVLTVGSLVSCSDRHLPAEVTPSAISESPTPTSTVTTASGGFPSAVFANLSEEPVSDELAAELQQVLEESGTGHGVTATLITPEGTWSGATGAAAGDRAMVPEDQMSIASITKTLVAAQVMQLVEAGELALDDLVADRLPPDLSFDTNGATIENLLSMRSGIPEFAADEDATREALSRDPLHVWTLDEKLATVSPDRGPVGEEWVYTGTNYLLLGLVIEQATGRPLDEVLRSGVLDGEGYERLVFQPAERPVGPVAMPLGAKAETFDDVGGYLPSLANATLFSPEGNMASDSPSLARWFRALCAGEVVTASSLDAMTDFDKRPGYGLGIIDRRDEYGLLSGALGHTGVHQDAYRTAALCFPQHGIVVAVLANAEEHDTDTTAGNLVQAASTD